MIEPRLYIMQRWNTDVHRTTSLQSSIVRCRDCGTGCASTDSSRRAAGPDAIPVCIQCAATREKQQREQTDPWPAINPRLPGRALEYLQKRGSVWDAYECAARAMIALRDEIRAAKVQVASLDRSRPLNAETCSTELARALIGIVALADVLGVDLGSAVERELGEGDET